MNLKKTMTVVCLSTVILGGPSVLAANHLDPSVAVIAESLPEENQESVHEPTIADKVQSILNEGKVTVSGVKPGHLYIPRDTEIELQLIDPISSKKNKEGNTFRLKTVDNVIINDVVIIPKDQEVSGVVLKAHGNGMFGRGGHLEINISSVRTVNHVNIPVNGYVNGYGSRDNGAVAVATVVTLVGGLFMKGENIYFQPGQLFKVKVQRDTDIEATPENLKEVMDNSRPQGQVLHVSVNP